MCNFARNYCMQHAAIMLKSLQLLKRVARNNCTRNHDIIATTAALQG